MEDVKQVWEKIRQGESRGGKVNNEGAFQIVYLFFVLSLRTAAALKSTYCCMQYAHSWDIFHYDSVPLTLILLLLHPLHIFEYKECSTYTSMCFHLQMLCLLFCQMSRQMCVLSQCCLLGHTIIIVW